MHLHVYVHWHRLLALLDSDSTHNFLDARAMRQLCLSMSPHPAMRILVANGDRIPYEGVARDVTLAIGTEEFSINCFGINLGGFDVILGVDFLRTLGPILWILRTCAWPSPEGPGTSYGRASAPPMTTLVSRPHE